MRELQQLLLWNVDPVLLELELVDLWRQAEVRTSLGQDLLAHEAVVIRELLFKGRVRLFVAGDVELLEERFNAVDREPARLQVLVELQLRRGEEIRIADLAVDA